MNVYDFDQTIFRGDSSIRFYLYVLKRRPDIIRFWPAQIRALLRYRNKKIDKTTMKTVFYRYFAVIKQMDRMVLGFWEHESKRLYDWYLAQKRPDDLIISASPEFFLAPLCQQLNVRLIASDVDPRTGMNRKRNCYGEEKVRRLFQKFPDAQIDSFYSDSQSDAPLAKLAQQAWLVIDGKPTVWDLK